ncbi:MAG: hypothetical protein K6F08_00935, partial [bacterium]|nr:hypothetical protein [bacterium]
SPLSFSKNFTIKSSIIPKQLMSFVDYYLNHKQYRTGVYKYSGYFHYFNCALLVAKIAYEQDDYYKIFGKKSFIFKNVSTVRNSVRHDNYKFTEGRSKISFSDNNYGFSEGVDETSVRLLAIDYCKEQIAESQGKISQEELTKAAGKLNQKFEEVFDETNSLENKLEFCFESYKEITDEEKEFEN